MLVIINNVGRSPGGGFSARADDGRIIRSYIKRRPRNPAVPSALGSRTFGPPLPSNRDARRPVDVSYAQQ